MEYEVFDHSSLKAAIDGLSGVFARENVPEEKVFDCKLALRELAENVLKHSKGNAVVEGRVADGFIELKIRSSTDFVPPTQSKCSDVYAENGRGLFLVDSVCYARTVEEGVVKILIQID